MLGFLITKMCYNRKYIDSYVTVWIWNSPHDSLVRGMVNNWGGFEKRLDHDSSDLISGLHHYSNHNLRTLFGNDRNQEMKHNGKMHINKWCALQETHAIFSASSIFSLYLSVSHQSSSNPPSVHPSPHVSSRLSVYLSISVSSISISLSPVTMRVLSSAKNSSHHAVLSQHKPIWINVIIDLNLWNHEPK